MPRLGPFRPLRRRRRDATVYVVTGAPPKSGWLPLSLFAALALGACTNDSSGASRTSSTTTAMARTTTTRAPTTSVPTGTVQVTYQAFVGDHLDPRLGVTSTDSGDCIRYGGGDQGHWIYRCFGMQTGDHSYVYDPCFDGPSGTAAPLACVTDPTVPKAVRFSVTSVDTATPPATTAYPWAMQLASGQVCLRVSGAWGSGGPFACQVISKTGSLADCHEPSAGVPWWSAACQEQNSDQSPFVPTQVAKIWF